MPPQSSTADPQAALSVMPIRRGARKARNWPAFDPRPYREHVGQFLIARRLTVGGIWTPFVSVRVRRLRAADGGTEN